MLNITGSGMFPPVTKNLLIINGLVFLALHTLGDMAPYVLNFLMLAPIDQDSFQIHQVITSGFTHYDFSHLFVNCVFGIWMFGKEVENLLGSKRYLILFITSIIGGSLAHLLLVPETHALGASGGTFGIMAAFALLVPNARILIYFLFPVKAKWLALGFVAYSIVKGMGASDGIGHFAHLGGMVAAFILIKYWKIPKFY